MPHSLLLLLKGPLQSWGDDSRYKQRTTQAVPSKSGVIGLLAAAVGRRRTDPLEDLAGLRFGVRVDQPGTVLRDFQTALEPKAQNPNLVTRHYLTDAVFVAAVESADREFLSSLEAALHSPRFPLYLGRRSCPAPLQLSLGIREGDLCQALRAEPWHAAAHHRKARSATVNLPIYRDTTPGEKGEPHRDVPVSFAQTHRQYAWREVIQDPEGVLVENLDSQVTDPFFEAVMRA
ncbi:type I-E CRISPR-associated protein Cas5/CasD [Corynebacterium lizhenjunii]|uniref:Type I-E CRISPR-associated protein Cas5/CasD n=1 Tax=Corynebacterium lizhenjunii TaxID=2709394 RepID=A0A7T0KFN1_9CORY|nr:type I-E CRISPR-associated protein Cas5/CasD [Corynebacterium lizhenjunii]QPK78813.1 type I-E CRISPR-associated protein Cas5/CasD [Corynebacterium lizhenjunii]